MLPIAQIRFRFQVLFERGVTTTLEAPVYRNGALLTPTAATCEVIRPDGTTLASGAATITDGVSTFQVAGALTANEALSMGLTVRWEITLSATETVRSTIPAAIVLRQLTPTLTDQDLLDMHSDLAAFASGSRTSLQQWIELTWWEIQRKLWGDKRRPWLIIDPTELLDAHRFLCLARISGDFAGGATDDGRWGQMRDRYLAEFRAAWSQLSFTYDTGESGLASNATQKSAAPVVFLCPTGYPRS